MTCRLAVFWFLVFSTLGYCETAQPVQVILENRATCPACRKSAVIFVHGLTGSQQTWRNQNGSYWPSMLATDFSTDIDIYRVDYSSGLESGAQAVEIRNGMATALDSVLFPEGQPAYEKIIFIAHSLGGIVTEAYTQHVAQRLGHSQYSHIRLAFFFGSPFKGSRQASVGALVSNNPQLRVLQPEKVNDFLQLLSAQSSDLHQKSIEHHCRYFRSYAGFEQKAILPVVGVVVSEASATAASSVRMGFDENHISLVKPASKNAPVYLWVNEALRSCLANGDNCPPVSTNCY